MSINGIATEELLEELPAGKNADETAYLKMAKYFPVRVKNGLCDIWSEHYGTELSIEIASAEDIRFLNRS